MGAVPVAALTFAGIPWAASALWTLIVVEVLFTIAMHSYRGPVISLLPDHTPPERNVQALPLVAYLGGRDRIGFYVGLYYLFTMVGQMIGPALLGGAMDLVGDQGLFLGGAVTFVVGSVLLGDGRRRLPDDPERLARTTVAASPGSDTGHR